jgi:CBS domain-containing protein
MESTIAKYIIDSQSTIKEAIRVISDNFTRCGVIVNQQEKVLGVLSEGDIVRSLVDDVALFAPVNKIIQPSFYFCRNPDLKFAFELLKIRGVTLLPIVDDKFRLKSVITIHDVLEILTLEKET